MVGCADPVSGPVHYRRALTTAATFEAAWAECVQIADLGDQGDCQASVTERFERRSAGDCEAIEHAVWKDECRFLLAERLGVAGDLDLALDTCVTSRFRRHCAWHLLEDAVEATILLPDAEAESAVDRFAAHNVLPDAGFQFWRVRHRLQNANGVSLDERNCVGLRLEHDCTRALHMHVQTLLDELARRGPERVCAAEPGQRVKTRGVVSWVPGPLVVHSETEWVTRRCPQGTAVPQDAATDAVPAGHDDGERRP